MAVSLVTAASQALPMKLAPLTAARLKMNATIVAMMLHVAEMTINDSIFAVECTALEKARIFINCLSGIHAQGVNRACESDIVLGVNVFKICTIK